MGNYTPRRDKQEWLALVEEQKQSGQTRDAFCKARGISISSFCYWQQKFKTHAKRSSPLTAATQTALVPVSPAHDDPMPGAQQFIEIKPPALSERASPLWDMELALGNGMTLRLRLS